MILLVFKIVNCFFVCKFEFCFLQRMAERLPLRLLTGHPLAMRARNSYMQFLYVGHLGSFLPTTSLAQKSGGWNIDLLQLLTPWLLLLFLLSSPTTCIPSHGSMGHTPWTLCRKVICTRQVHLYTHAPLGPHTCDTFLRGCVSPSA
jgi:hypothetical protein